MLVKDVRMKTRLPYRENTAADVLLTRNALRLHTSCMIGFIVCTMRKHVR